MKRKMSDAPDFIPISSNNNKPPIKKRKSLPGVQKTPSNHGTPIRYSEIFGDRRLVPRIKDLMECHDFQDCDTIVDKLRSKFPEYNRKQRSSFKVAVTKGLTVLDDLMDQEMDELRPDYNSLNQSLSEVYAKETPDSKSGTRGTLSAKKKKKLQESAEKSIEKSLEKQVELKEKYIFEPQVTYSDLGGINQVIQKINKLVLHIQHPELYSCIGIEAPRGFLIHGPPGVGKTMLVEAIASELKVNFLKVTSTELVTGISGESESKIRQLFNLSKSMEPCILFIDEIDAICQKRDSSSREMEKRIVTQMLTCIDSLDPKTSKVMVIGATGRLDSLDPSLRRSGRFDREISLGIPDETARIDILKILCRDIKLSDGFDFEILARNTPGYVGADLKSLIREAAIHCLELKLVNGTKDLTEGDIDVLKKTLFVDMAHFNHALKHVQPSAKREGFATVPDVTWDDVGALNKVREELQLSILAPIKYPKDIKSLGIKTSVGLLLCGPPGCGKTLLAKAIANESGVNFISVKGPELLNMYVGESERAVRSVFTRARHSSPCVLFFDEIDALCRKRSDEGSVVSSSVVNQLLTEMDGVENRCCILLAATNRPDILDPAILRPGRFDKMIYVGFPDSDERFEILMTITKKGTQPPCDSNVDFMKIAQDQRTDGYSGADLSALVREASNESLKDRIHGRIPEDQKLTVTSDHFEYALRKIKASISQKEKEKYLKMKLRFELSTDDVNN